MTQWLSMPSFAQRFYIQNPGPLQALWRNLRLLGMLTVAAGARLVSGLFLHRAMRRARKSGNAVILEDHFG